MSANMNTVQDFVVQDLEAEVIAAADAHAQTAVPASPVGSAGQTQNFDIFLPTSGGQQIPQQHAAVEALHSLLRSSAWSVRART